MLQRSEQAGSNLRVIHTIASLRKSAGGPTRTVTSLCRELGRLGVEVDLLSQGETGSVDEANLIPPAEWVTTTLAPARRLPVIELLWHPNFRAMLREPCGKRKSLLIHDHGLWLPSNHVAASVARQFGLPLIISPRGMLEPWALNHRVWKKRMAWRLYQQQDLRSAYVLHATSDQEADNLRRLGLRQPIALIPNGVELPEMGEAPEAFRPVLSAEDVSSDSRIALFLSRIHPKKGLLELVDAWSIVRPAGWRMVIAGPDEGKHRAEVEARLQAKDLIKHFEFVGAVDDQEKTALYRNADLFVLPTFSENFGVVVAEALAHGLPVITTKGAPWADLETYRCGWWIDIGVDSLVNALRQAMSLTYEERREMGERGKTYVQRYAWDSIAQRTVGVYRWLIGKGQKPDCVMTD